MSRETREERAARLDHAADLMANAYHNHTALDVDPDISRAKWKDHIMKTHNDPVAHYGSNGQGLDEYRSFINNNNRGRLVEINSGSR